MLQLRYPHGVITNPYSMFQKVLPISGKVKDFVMNDKCSAGTGRFLEVMANTLGLDSAALCMLAEKGGYTAISSLCTVFAESEVISLIGRGEQKGNIAFGVVDSIAKKVASQARHFGEIAGELPGKGENGGKQP